MGPVNCLMAARCPTGSLLDETKAGMVHSTDHERILARFREMALQAEVGVTDLQHLVVGAPVGRMAGLATFPHGLMLEHEWSGLRRMALSTGSTLRHEDALGKERLILIPVRVMAVHAGNHTLPERMAVRQGKLPLHVEVTLQAGLG